MPRQIKRSCPLRRWKTWNRCSCHSVMWISSSRPKIPWMPLSEGYWSKNVVNLQKKSWNANLWAREPRANWQRSPMMLQKHSLGWKTWYAWTKTATAKKVKFLITTGLLTTALSWDLIRAMIDIKNEMIQYSSTNPCAGPPPEYLVVIRMATSGDMANF